MFCEGFFEGGGIKRNNGGRTDREERYSFSEPEHVKTLQRHWVGFHLSGGQGWVNKLKMLASLGLVKVDDRTTDQLSCRAAERARTACSHLDLLDTAEAKMAGGGV